MARTSALLPFPEQTGRHRDHQQPKIHPGAEPAMPTPPETPLSRHPHTLPGVEKREFRVLTAPISRDNPP